MFPQETDVSDSVIVKTGRFQRSQTRPYSQDVLRLNYIRELEIGMSVAEENVLQSPACIARALETADKLCRFAKDPTCIQERREEIYTLKNILLKTLWKKKNDLFQGVWLHSSRPNHQICWQCKGSGISNNGYLPCRKCRGTGRWKPSERMVLTVFAIRCGNYTTTWHIPSIVVRRIFGTTLVMTDDLIGIGKWIASDVDKVTESMTDDDYELGRSYLAWFMKYCGP